jgi:hypothetical protein
MAVTYRPSQNGIDTMSTTTTRSAPRLRALLMIFAMILTAVHLAAAPGYAAEWRQDAHSFSRGSFMGTEVDSAESLSLSSFVGANLAFGTMAVAGENTLTGSRSLTDGDPSTEWRFNNKAEVLGEWIRVDLGGDRLEVAAEDTPDDWVLVAQQIDNHLPTVDTTLDSTWLETDAQGQPLPVLGRSVRLKIMREDPPNWVSIGDIQVFGEGFRARGTFDSEVFGARCPIVSAVAQSCDSSRLANMPSICCLNCGIRSATTFHTVLRSTPKYLWINTSRSPAIRAHSGGVCCARNSSGRFLAASPMISRFRTTASCTI